MASMLISNPSIVEWFAEHEGYRCGYCKQEDTNYSHGMWAHALTVQDYQDLIDRGWRRSGKYCYKPTMNLTCCPHYTVRCHAGQFRLNKSHKKLLKRVNRFLIKGEKPGEAKSNPDLSAANDGSQAGGTEMRQTTDQPKTEKKQPKKGDGPDPSKPACKKAKELRKERKLQKLAAKTENSNQDAESGHMEQRPSSSSQNSNEPKSLEDFLDEPFKADNPAHRLEIKLVRSTPRSPDFTRTFEESHNIYLNYQVSVHKDPPEKPNKKQYTRFLVDSCLQPYMNDKLKEGYGSFHQQYILDGKMIAVGVVDILPHCVSSVYLYYDPQYDFLSLGTYTALQELAFTRRLTQQDPDLQYYYMGYYIHTCPKMKYKGQYVPSYLLCPETYLWQPIERCVPKLDQSNYSRLEEDTQKGDENGQVNVDRTLILHDGDAMTYGRYKRLKKNATDMREVEEYAGFVGRKCAERMLLFRK